MYRLPMPQATKRISTVPHGKITCNFTAQEFYTGKRQLLPTLVADHEGVPLPGLPVQQRHIVAWRIEGVHDRKGLPVRGPAQTKREDHGDEALLEGLAC